ncbi:MAG: UDP-N-acetylglucosamine 2-epimerase (non-hydrolyzing) [Deltaproteobacteria bacterium]|jgi:UDP-N-acetylglucosamine 2-epimerase (non-hydrolysing)|nr:UDP-N-acetylglucosamine 2-epimerase (non-hydrolyzing) [Deltaproteobacteria bacterium]
MKIVNIVGARPNFMKIAPLMRAYKQYNDSINPVLVHTGQHYDETMSKTFFEQLDIPRPDINLGVGSGSHAEQTAKIMMSFEKLIKDEKPDIVLVVGDVNSTMACTITAAKFGIKTVHVEAGLRSFDMTMPEEINRKVTDSICDYLFTTEESANKNLRNEGVKEERIFFVGNVMIDTLAYYLDKIKDMPLPFRGLTQNNSTDIDGIVEKNYATLTMHRPSNVDDRSVLEGIFFTLEKIQKDIPIVFPMHPRTRKNIDHFGLSGKVSGMRNLIITEPIGYFEFLRLNKTAKFILTDSGGLQEETTYLRIPCLTLRENTERPVTIDVGTNVLVGSDPDTILDEYGKIMNGNFKKGRTPFLWDGHAAERIVEQLAELA